MTPREIKIRMELAAKHLTEVHDCLKVVHPNLAGVDYHVVSKMLTEVAWAAENCTVIALHQEGKAMEDDMGATISEDLMVAAATELRKYLDGVPNIYTIGISGNTLMVYTDKPIKKEGMFTDFRGLRVMWKYMKPFEIDLTK